MCHGDAAERVDRTEVSCLDHQTATAGRDSLSVRRLPVTFTSDIHRVITRFFDPGGETRIRSIVERVRSLSGGQVDRLLDEVFLKFVPATAT